MGQDVLAELFSDTYTPPPFSLSLYDVIDETGGVVVHGVERAVATRVRKDYREMFGGSYDIIETHTQTPTGQVLFTGTPAVPSHVPSHVVSHVPLYDVQIDAHVVGRNLTPEAAHAFVRETVDILDIFSAIVEFIVSDDFDNGETLETRLHTLQTISANKVYGATFIKYNPAHNDAPAPMPGIYDNEKKFSGRTKIFRTREYSVPGVPEAAREYSIIDITNLSIRHSGTKDTCKMYLRQMKEQGIKTREMRVIKYNEVQDYLAKVKLEGYRVTQHGATLVMGTKDECRKFVGALLLTQKNPKVYARTLKISSI